MLGIQKDAAKKLVNALDQNCDGSIQYLEFCAACLLASTDELYALLSQAPALALHPKLLTQKPCLPCFRARNSKHSAPGKKATSQPCSLDVRVFMNS